MFRLLRHSVLAALPIFVVTLTFQAQETLTSASVTGRVVDPSGLVVPQAKVTAVATATNLKYTVVTDQQGRFRVPYLPIGEICLLCAINRFRTGFAQNSVNGWCGLRPDSAG